MASNVRQMTPDRADPAKESTASSFSESSLREHRVSVWLPEHLWQHLVTLAEQEGSPLAAVVRRIVYQDYRYRD